MNTRMLRAGRHQQLTLELLRELGNDARPYGQEMVPPETRRLLQAAANPARERWTADFIVNPVAGDDLVLVDSKFALASHGGNQSIEMRSLLAAKLDIRPTYYVCATLSDVTGRWADWKSIESRLVPTTWPCCQGCARIYAMLSPAEALRELPAYCPNRDRSDTASQTPFFVVERSAFPEGVDIFGITAEPHVPPGRERRSIADEPSWCRFAAGSTHCVNDPCGNPNHREVR